MAGIERTRIVGMSDEDLDEYSCGICQDIFNDPVMAQCCRQTYCKVCIEEWLSSHTNCPNDRQELRANELIPVPRFALNFLNKMQIKCKYEDRGCPVITTIGELSKHMEECEHKPDLNCKTCGLNKADGEEHNCVADLVIKNNSIVEELKRLQKEIQELKKLSQSSTTGMPAVLESARRALNDYVIEKSVNLEPSQQQFLIVKCKQAIETRDSFVNICEYLYREINNSELCRSSRQWIPVVYSNEGGQSAAVVDQILRLRFGVLNIKLFTLVDFEE